MSVFKNVIHLKSTKAERESKIDRHAYNPLAPRQGPQSWNRALLAEAGSLDWRRPARGQEGLSDLSHHCRLPRDSCSQKKSWELSPGIPRQRLNA